MNSFVIECESEDELERIMETLRNQYRMTGEMHARRREDGRWRLVVHSEKAVREATIEKLKGRRLDAGD